MSQMWAVTIPGKPRPLKRHRSGQTRQYDPNKSAKRDIRTEVLIAHKVPKEPFTGPICLYVRFVEPRPKRMPKGKRHAITKCDLDNLIKMICDAFGRDRHANPDGFVWRDDAQVIFCMAGKRYADENEKPRTEVLIIEIGQDEEIPFDTVAAEFLIEGAVAGWGKA